MVFYWSLSNSKSLQVSRTLLSILADLNNVVVWIVSTRPLFSKSSSPFINHLVTVPRAPITIDITVTFMFHSFFNSLARSKYLSFFSHSFNFTLRSARTAKSTILQVLLFLLIIIRSGRLTEIKRCVWMWKSQSLCVSHSSGQMLGCAYTICSYGQVQISCTFPSGSLCQIPMSWQYILCVLLLFTLLEFFTSVLADGLSLEFEWEQVSSSFQNSSQYSGRSQ